jgi:GDPmannose 4,6-dehydratase
MKTALVTGVTGQDGSYLSELLLDKQYRVLGLKRRSSTNSLSRLGKSMTHPNFSIVEGEVADSGCVYEVVNRHKPDEIYNLAAQSHVATSFEQPDFTFQVNALGPLHFLEAIRRFSPSTKFYQASTSEMFGKNFTENYAGKYQDEDTVLMPQSPYAVAKVAAHHLVRIYREAYDIFACCGILFNHESERRGEEFVTRKITKWIGEFSAWVNRHDIKYDDLVFDADEIYIPGRVSRDQGFQFPKLRLGNLDARRDWGHAEDYVDAMYAMLQKDSPKDYVIATGKTYSIRDFLNEAFSIIEVWDWTDYVVIDPKFYRPAEVEYLQGLPQRAQSELGWTPKITFEELVKIMVSHDINAAQELE